MPNFIGSRAEVGIAKEGVRGTAVAPTYWLRPSEFKMDEAIDHSIEESQRGVIEDSPDLQVVGLYAQGEVTMPMRDLPLGLLLLSTYGSVASVLKGGEVAVFNHTFSVQNSNQHQSLTLHLKTPVSGKDFTLIMISKLELMMELGKHIIAKASVRSKAGAVQVRVPSYSTSENIFVPQHCTFKTAVNLAGLGAASPINVRVVKLAFNKNVEDDRALGNLNQIDINNKGFTCEGEFEMTYQDDANITALMAGTMKALRITVSNTDVTIGAASNPTLQVDFAKVKFLAVDRKFVKGGIVTQLVKFKAFYSDSDSVMTTAVLTNIATSY